MILSSESLLKLFNPDITISKIISIKSLLLQTVIARDFSWIQITWALKKFLVVRSFFGIIFQLTIAGAKLMQLLTLHRNIFSKMRRKKSLPKAKTPNLSWSVVSTDQSIWQIISLFFTRSSFMGYWFYPSYVSFETLFEIS